MYVGCTVQQGSYTTMMLSVEKGTACDRVLLSHVATSRRVNASILSCVDECRACQPKKPSDAMEAPSRAMLRRPIGLLPSAATRAERIPESVAQLM